MKQTAQGLAALGRGPDTQLVHMAPSEVAGLQALAQQHGGSLTINPDTGLPEAGFLSSILPMVLGAGAMMIPGVGPMMAAGLVGGGYGLATGSLSKGLMAGLGAYGGASLGSSLAAAAPEALASAAPTVAQAPGLAEIGNASAQSAGAGSPTLFNAAQQANTGLGTGFGEAFNPGATSAIYPTAPSPSAFPTTTTPAPQIALGPAPTPTPTFERMGAGLKDVFSSGDKALAFAGKNAMPLGAMGLSALGSMQPDALNATPQNPGLIRPYTYSREKIPGAFEDVAGAPRSSKERRYFNDQFTAGTPYAAPGAEYMAAGGPVEAMSNANAIGASTSFPQADIRTGAYSTPFQQPIGQNVVTGVQDAAVDPYTGQQQFAMGGGVSDLGGYSDGGRLLRGPGDGVSDSIPAMIGQKQQARLADGEFVVPARIVSELGNGSTEAGARQLYAMMDRVQKNRKKSMGKDKVAADSKSSKLLPA